MRALWKSAWLCDYPQTIDDNLYKAEFGPSNDGLMESFKETEEIYSANVFNTSTPSIRRLAGDNVALPEFCWSPDRSAIRAHPQPAHSGCGL